MLVPFIFDLRTWCKANLLWPFYHGLDFAKETKSAIIARELYINTPVSAFRRDGRVETLNEYVDKHYLYQIPSDLDLQSKRIYTIPETLVEELIAEKGSMLEAWCYVLSEADKRLCACIEELVQRIEMDCAGSIEAFISFAEEVPALTAVAKKKNIPVIHWELGGCRYPVYLNTAYWDLKNLFGKNSVEERWRRFCQEREGQAFPEFSKKEVLALLLERQYLYLIEEYDKKPARAIGVALGGINGEENVVNPRISDSELLYLVKEKYGLENMLIRLHPGVPGGNAFYDAAIERKQRNSAEFVLHCETVSSVMSGICIEAMMFNKKTITLRECPAYFHSGHTIEGEGICPGEDFNSFFVFCYLVPLEYMMDVNYLRWRLTDPTEYEIYYKHLEFYFKKKGLPTSLILKSKGERLNIMLKLQNH